MPSISFFGGRAGGDSFCGGLAWRTSPTALFAQGGALPVAFDVELEDRRVMDQAIDARHWSAVVTYRSDDIRLISVRRS